ncbi:MAG TPA: DUF5335 family protein [Pyrinomonadaceae bacterium]|nr:DUF5335 family protein [Pyrinomonadaceae bacterium]
MNAAAKQHNWTTFLKVFSEQNLMRPTRIGVFEGEPDLMTDYWIENGLPLTGIAVDRQNGDGATVEIMLGDGTKADSRHMTHVVNGAWTIKIILSADAESDGLVIEDAERRMTVLRFED